MSDPSNNDRSPLNDATRGPISRSLYAANASVRLLISPSTGEHRGLASDYRRRTLGFLRAEVDRTAGDGEKNCGTVRAMSFECVPRCETGLPGPAEWRVGKSSEFVPADPQRAI
jgi:hypothetical protein